MRTGLFVIAMALMDIARTNGKIYPDDVLKTIVVIAVIAMIMDIVDFFRGSR